MSDFVEALQLALPAKLASVTAATRRILAWCRIQGVPAETAARVELPLVEAMNNAIEHGCARFPDATVEIVTRVTSGLIVVTILDPGRFEPPANWSELPEDPLAEGGRGGFIIHNGTDGWEHANTEHGHSLTLRWKASPRAGHGLETAAAAEADMDRLTEELANSFETLAGLTHFAGLLATSASFSQLLDKVHERLRSMLAHESLLIRFLEKKKLRCHPLGQHLPVPAELALDAAFAESACASLRRQFVGHRDNLPPGDPLGDLAPRLCVLTIEFGGKILGTLVATRLEDVAFSAGEVELLQAVADFIGIAKATDNLWHERKQQLRLEEEINVAAGIQRSLLPASFPSGGRWLVHGECRPAREVGGDYFDVVTLPDGGLLLLIADVMGKGLPASLLAAMLRSSLRALSVVESSPAAILTGINNQLFPDLVELGMFITAVLVKLPANPERSPVFANAGHCAPAILRADGSLLEPRGGNAPLGVLPDTLYVNDPLPLARGDRLLLYTDGCFELPGPDGGELLGSANYLRHALDRRRLPVADFVATLLDPASLQLNPDHIADDRTLLVADFRT